MDTVMGILFFLMTACIAAFILPWFYTYLAEFVRIIIDHFKYN